MENGQGDENLNKEPRNLTNLNQYFLAQLTDRRKLHTGCLLVQGIYSKKSAVYLD